MMLYCIYKNADKEANYELDELKAQNKGRPGDGKLYTPTKIYKADSINGKEILELHQVVVSTTTADHN